MAFGGRIAEELIGGEDAVTTGAYSDIQMATRIARAMITKSGFSENLGPVHYGEEQSETGAMLNYSPETSKLIDEEVRKLIDDSYEIARKVLTDNMDILHAMKDALMEYETIDSAQVDDLMARRPVRPPKDWDSGASNGSSGKTETKEQGQDKGQDDVVGDPANSH